MLATPTRESVNAAIIKMGNAMRKVFFLGKIFTCAIMLVCSSMSFAESSPVRWVKNCASALPAHASAQMIGVGDSIVVSVKIGFESATLVCAHSGRCTGLRNRSELIPQAEARIARINRDSFGLVYTSIDGGQFQFRCR